MTEEKEPISEEITENTDILTEDVENAPAENANAEDSAWAELAEMKDKYLRLYADFENFRRRTAKERVEMIQTASVEVIKDLLPIWDDIERASTTFATAEDGRVEKEGIELIFNKFKNTLTTKGVKPMETKGEVFDVDLHECITQFPAPTEDLKGKVIDEVERGYKLYDKVIRFAKVVVGQ